LLLASCSTIAGPKGEYIGEIACKGKGTVTVTGGPGFTGTIMAECDKDEANPGFSFKHIRERKSEK